MLKGLRQDHNSNMLSNYVATKLNKLDDRKQVDSSLSKNQVCAHKLNYCDNHYNMMSKKVT